MTIWGIGFLPVYSELQFSCVFHSERVPFFFLFAYFCFLSQLKTFCFKGNIRILQGVMLLYWAIFDHIVMEKIPAGVIKCVHIFEYIKYVFFYFILFNASKHRLLLWNDSKVMDHLGERFQSMTILYIDSKNN